MDKIEKLNSIIEGQQANYNHVYNELYLPNKEDSWFKTLHSLLQSNCVYIGIQFFVNNFIQNAKQQFSTSSKAAYVLIKKYDEKMLDYDIKIICVALLSDNIDIINKIAKVKHSNYEQLLKMGESTINYVFQAAILEDWEEFDRLIEIVKLKSIKKYPTFQLDYDFFVALKAQDKLGCENALNKLLEKRTQNVRNKISIYKDFFSFPALGYAKLAWLNGIEVDINHELVPKVLLPINPNKDYFDEYDFLRDI